MYSPTERETLVVLLVRGPSNSGGVGDECGRHPRSISRTLRGLKNDGLVAAASDRGPYSLTLNGVREARSILKRDT